MSTILLRIADDGVIRLAANRDEFRSRPFDPPDMLVQGAFGGRDLEAGGTWLAVGRDRLAAVTNIRGLPTDPEKKTRGLLPLLALMGGLPATFEDYNPFNLVVIGPDERRVITHLGGTTPPVDTPLGVGDHAILNEPFSLAATGRPSARRRRALELLAEKGPGFEALSDHDADLDATPCRHGQTFGTVCATVLTWLPGAGVSRYLWCEGAPCEEDTRDLTAACRRSYTVVRWDGAPTDTSADGSE